MTRFYGANRCFSLFFYKTAQFCLVFALLRTLFLYSCSENNLKKAKRQNNNIFGKLAKKKHFCTFPAVLTIKVNSLPIFIQLRANFRATDGCYCIRGSCDGASGACHMPIHIYSNQKNKILRSCNSCKPQNDAFSETLRKPHRT